MDPTQGRGVECPALLARLRAIVPSQVQTFNKLTNREKPYRFHAWADDRQGRLCLRYEFDLNDGGKNVKRLIVAEIFVIVRQLRTAGRINRATYAELCPVSAGDGACGFAVLGRLMEAIGVARYAGERGFLLTDSARLDKLLS